MERKRERDIEFVSGLPPFGSASHSVQMSGFTFFVNSNLFLPLALSLSPSLWLWLSFSANMLADS